MISDAELASLKAAERARKESAAKRSALHDQQHALFYSHEPALELLSGRTDQWLRWIAVQLRGAASEEAFLAAKVEHQKNKAARAFGRAQILAELARNRGS